MQTFETFNALKGAVRRVQKISREKVDPDYFADEIGKNLEVLSRIRDVKIRSLELKIMKQLGLVNDYGITEEGKRIYEKLKKDGFYEPGSEFQRWNLRRIPQIVRSSMFEEKHRYDIVEPHPGIYEDFPNAYPCSFDP